MLQLLKDSAAAITTLLRSTGGRTLDLLQRLLAFGNILLNITGVLRDRSAHNGDRQSARALREHLDHARSDQANERELRLRAESTADALAAKVDQLTARLIDPVSRAGETGLPQADGLP